MVYMQYRMLSMTYTVIVSYTPQIFFHADNRADRTMKHLLSFSSLALMLLATTTYGATDSLKVRFRNVSWNEALRMARTENRYLVLDAYTDWCGWCKVMD